VKPFGKIIGKRVSCGKVGNFMDNYLYLGREEKLVKRFFSWLLVWSRLTVGRASSKTTREAGGEVLLKRILIC
jgi:hypothetical protein